MFGGFDSGIEKNINFFKKYKINPTRSGIAFDLGAGCGFQSIPLAKAGFTVTAIDLDRKLLNELNNHSDNLPIEIIEDDLFNFDKYVNKNPELIVCMTDTLIHLDSQDKVISLFDKVASSLEAGGKLIISYRDLSFELSELDRFIPVKSDNNIVFTCFLEYEPKTVKIHDIVYKKEGNSWCLKKSYYRKLRLSKEWVDERLSATGFTKIESTIDKGFVTTIAVK